MTVKFEEATFVCHDYMSRLSCVSDCCFLR